MNFKLLKNILVAGTALGMVASASAIEFDFDDLTGAPDGDDFLPVSPWFLVTTKDVGSSESGSPLGGSLTYENGGISVKTTAFYQVGGTGDKKKATVVQDNGGTGVAGLGVYSESPFVPSDDNITGRVGDRVESLVLEFSELVNVKFRFNADEHKPLLTAKTFLLTQDGGPLTRTAFNAGTTYSGTIFTFTYDMEDGGQQFYLAGATVPDGGTTIFLLGLSVLGLGAVRRFTAKK